MKLRMNWALAGYILAGLLMLAAFLYLRFPGETAKAWIKALAATRYPQMLLSVDTVAPGFPPGLVIGNITSGPRERPEATLHADRLVIRPAWLSLLGGRLALIFGAEGYGGSLKGRIDHADKFSLEGPVSVEAQFREIRIEKCAWLRDILARQIVGTLKGSVSFSFSGASEKQKSRTVDIEMVLTNGSYPLLENFLGFEKIDFSKVEAKINIRNNALRISEMTLKGEKLNCFLKGNVLLAEDIRDSQIDLACIFSIPTEKSKRMTLVITGTLGDPKTKLR